MVHLAGVQPEKARQFAVEVVRVLRASGYEAFWAGGCVRDQLLGRRPKDYDVATDAQPAQVREVFGRRRTLPLGAAFGVITVLGPKQAGQIEVATFREDAAYSDGRHPDQVHYSTAKKDASRRDFTINGLFYDPIKDQVIDFVGGQEDLRRRRIRAIGDPVERFTEDKLRMLRALRFSANLDFQLDPKTLEAIRQMADQIEVVSPERISAEMRQVLTDPRRAAGVRLLVDSNLGAAILPEIGGGDRPDRERIDHTLEVLDRLDAPPFPLAFAVVVAPSVNVATAERIGRRWRLANKEIDRLGWLLRHRGALDAASQRPWSSMQRVLVAEGAGDLLNWMQAERATDGADDADVRWCREQLTQPCDRIDPEMLLSGDDLIRHGIARGPIYRELLDRVRDAQLDGDIATKAQALALVDRLLAEDRSRPNTRQPRQD